MLGRLDLEHASQWLLDELPHPLDRDHRGDPVAAVAVPDQRVARLPVRLGGLDAAGVFAVWEPELVAASGSTLRGRTA